MSPRSQPDTSPKPWDTPNLPPKPPGTPRCAHHKNLCAYRDDDPARCTRCHRSKEIGCGCQQ